MIEARDLVKHYALGGGTIDRVLRHDEVDAPALSLAR